MNRHLHCPICKERLQDLGNSSGCPFCEEEPHLFMSYFRCFQCKKFFYLGEEKGETMLYRIDNEEKYQKHLSKLKYE